MSVSKLFILYCKDKLLKDGYAVQEIDFCDDVLQLAEALAKCGEIEVVADFYENQHQQNWSLWTEERIKECAYVIMVCSPQLHQSLTLSAAGRKQVEMYKGLFYNDCVVNCITAPKFVPVFLNKCKPEDLRDWLPTQLHAGRKFCLPYLREFHQLVYQAQDSMDVFNHLNNEKFRDIASLVTFVRGEHEGVLPEGPQCYVPVAAVGEICEPSFQSLDETGMKRDPLRKPWKYTNDLPSSECSSSSSTPLMHHTSSPYASPQLPAIVGAVDSGSGSKPAESALEVIDIHKRYFTDDPKVIGMLNQQFIHIVSGLNEVLRSHPDVKGKILPILRNLPLFLKNKHFQEKLQTVHDNITGEDLVRILPDHWDELHPNILFHLINILRDPAALVQKGQDYQGLLRQCCTTKKVRHPEMSKRSSVERTPQECFYLPELGSMLPKKVQFMVIASDGNISPPGVEVARRLPKQASQQILENYEHASNDTVPEIEALSQSVALELQIVKKKISRSKLKKLTSIHLDTRGNEKTKQFYLEEIEKFIKCCRYAGAYIWFIGHSEKDTGNWCFKDGTISFNDIFKIYKRYQEQKEKLLTIISDCSYSGNWVYRCAETLDNEKIPPCGHKANDQAILIRIYCSAEASQQAQEICYSEEGVHVRKDGDFSFLDESFSTEQNTCHGDFTKLVCCRGQNNDCRMDRDIREWTWTDLVKRVFHKHIRFIKGIGQSGNSTPLFALLLKKGKELTKLNETEMKKIILGEWGYVLDSSTDEDDLIYRIFQCTCV